MARPPCSCSSAGHRAAQQGAQVVAAAGEQAQEELAFGGQAGAVAVAAEGLRDAADDADLAAAVGIAPALGGLARRLRACSGSQREDRADSAAPPRAEGSTSSMRQPLVAPTSMYSMKRSTTPLP
jgi:hypothetical protein